MMEAETKKTKGLRSPKVMETQKRMSKSVMEVAMKSPKVVVVSRIPRELEETVATLVANPKRSRKR